MTNDEIRDLKAKSLLVLKGLFAASFSPVTLQQIHPAQIGTAAAMHAACVQELGLPGVGEIPQDPRPRVCYHLDGLEEIVRANRLSREALFDVRDQIFKLTEIMSNQLVHAVPEQLDGKGGGK